MFRFKKTCNTWCHGILRSLFNFGVRGNLKIFIQKLYPDVFYGVRVGSVLSEACPLEDVVPQGSILGLTLFAVARDGYYCPT